MFGCSSIHIISYATIAVIFQRSSIHGNCWCQAFPGVRGPSSSIRSTESPSAALSALPPMQRPPRRRLLSLQASGALSVYSRPSAQAGMSDALSSKPDTRMALPTQLVVEVGGVRQGVVNLSIPALRIDQFIKPGARGEGEEVAPAAWKE